MELRIKIIKKENISNLMRKIGYYFFDNKSGDLNFVRPLNPGGFPRFHLYIKNDNETEGLILKLHLDQKKPVYKGVSAHGGEYEGKLVEDESLRIKQILEQQ